MKDLIKKQTLHDEVLELLPWFVNSTLEGKERIKVMTHLGDCPTCQKERDRLQQLQALVQQENADSTGDYKPSFEKLMDRIDASESGFSVVKEGSVENPKLAQVVAVKRRVHSMLPYAVAASLFVAVGFVLMSQPEPAETLNVPATTSPSVDPSAALGTDNIPRVNQRLMLTFEDQIDSEMLRAAFVSTGAYIVSGPDAEGRYIVEVMANPGQDSDQLIHSIVEVEGVEYAKLID